MYKQKYINESVHFKRGLPKYLKVLKLILIIKEENLCSLILGLIK